jgi:hypothetical protein
MESQPESCTNHPDNPASNHCGVCSRPLCAVCTFDVHDSLLCPDCLTAAAARAKRPPVAKAIGSLVLAVVGVLMLGAMFVVGAFVEEGSAMLVAMGLSFGALGSLLGGTTLGFIGREEGRGQSATATVGIVANILMLAFFLVLSVLGNFSK